MRTVIAIAAVSLSLAGCSSMSMDAFKSTPKTISLPVDSVPQGADATSSLGPSCKTPCSLPVSDDAEGLSVSFALPNYQPLTVPVQVIRHKGDYFTSSSSTTFDPDPVVGELQAAEQPRRKRGQRKPRRRSAARAAAPAAPASVAAPTGAPPPPAAR